jgi:hypothetical protein
VRNGQALCSACHGAKTARAWAARVMARGVGSVLIRERLGGIRPRHWMRGTPLCLGRVNAPASLKAISHMECAGSTARIER